MTSLSRVTAPSGAIRTMVALALALLALAPDAAAQSPTGTLTGRVTDALGASLPGVGVTIDSPALQGTQTTMTSQAGDYVFKWLPPGSYTASLHLPGFATVRFTRSISAAEAVAVDVTLVTARIEESVTVRADAGPFARTMEGATNIAAPLMGSLPTTRTMLAAVALAPAVHMTGPANGVSISGAMSFESLFLVNGVPVQENLRGQPLSLFIEDAIQETTVISSGVPASKGRFVGGVVNTITRSGGDSYSGSLRTRFTNDAWRTTSPFGEKKADRVVPTVEGTFGGPIARDRLWFFAAVRAVDNVVSRETGVTRIAYERRQQEERVEAKVTGTIGARQRLAVNYLGVRSQTTNSAWPSASEIMDLASLTSPRNPQSIVGAHYTGSVGTRLFVQAQYSARKFTFERAGGFNTDLIAGTPLLDQSTGAWWWAPNFCAVCPAEERNNESLAVTGSYFLSTGAGAHDLEFGYDGFNDATKADNHQSATDYHVWATGSLVDNGVVYPVIEPGFSTFIVHWPLQGQSQGANFRTHGLFVQDRWAVNGRLTLGLGLRYDRHDGRDGSGALVSNDSAWSPRLGVTWDPTGSGRMAISASASRYVTGLNSGVAGSASRAGTPSIIAYFYDGQPINAGAGPLVPTDAALAQVFDWFNAAQPGPFHVELPGVSTRIKGRLASPRADEFALGISRQFGARTTVRADVVDRQFSRFYSKRIDMTTGQSADEYGQPFDLGLIENTNDLERRYRALNVQADYRGTGLVLGTSYTLSRLRGNVNGETNAAGAITSDIHSYPEYLDRGWFAPTGDLAADQRHRARLWAVYTMPWTRVARMSVGAIQTLESGTPYGAVGTAVVSPFIDNPGYALAPDTRTYFFTARDAFRTKPARFTDVSINVARGLPGRAQLFAEFHVLNVFNEFQIVQASELNTTVFSWIDDDRLNLFDPFTETPIEGEHWRKSNSFGKTLSERGVHASEDV